MNDMKKTILHDAHKLRYTIHPGSTKMYQNLKRQYRWRGMKKDVRQYVSECVTCLQIKVEHQKPAGELQPLPVPGWKWEHITMNFLMGLSRTEQKHDAIWVVVDRLTKSAHFIPFRATYSWKILAELYLEHAVRLHGVPLSITSDRDTCFNARPVSVWHHSKLSTVVLVDHMFVAQSCQKINVDRRRRPLEFQEGEFVLLEVSPCKGVIRFRVKGKLAPRYVGPFPIVQRVGVVAYRLSLPPELSHVHDVFYVLMLCKCQPDPEAIVQWYNVSIQYDVTYEEAPVQILNRKMKSLCHREILLVKVLW
ncbi:uncharacterized protein LOC112093304 [Morus notabilis]|uniref:uncharacterized protein LOC112093304 n=1 Tax=Morus notabilis TaxID=981085 RepID=UPI000CED40FF|nr:uncharacterized protein LOC112093304 [Morus notabilis]